LVFGGFENLPRFPNPPLTVPRLARLGEGSKSRK
jgi:hypothetical protein